MANKIILKRSAVASNAPTTGDLDYGELAINYNDGRLYYKTSGNTIDYFTAGGDIEGVTAGNGLTGGGTSGSVTLNIGAGTGIDVAADSISVDVSDFMSNGADNRVLTATGTDAMNAEANLTFNGSTLGVTGNITVSGTVDGRDVAADGTKLDSIESGATADQTASEILTAIKTVDGSGSGLDADTLDGIQGSSYLRSDTSDSFTSGTLTFSAGTALNGAQATTSTNYALLSKFLANPASEDGSQEDVRIINDLAGADRWATSITLTDVYTYDRTTPRTTLSSSSFDGTSSFDVVYQNVAGDPLVIELDISNNMLTYSCWVGIIFGHPNWRAKSVKIEVFRNSAWQTLCDLTNQPDNVVARSVSGNDGNGVTKIRYTLDDLQNTTNNYIRIHTLFALNYKSGDNSYGGVHYMEKYKDVGHYGDIVPQGASGTYELGSSSQRYAYVYTTNLDVSSNITVSGTVDGRDVAADGTKLDGIESGATADQTITAGSGLTGGGTGDVTINIGAGTGIDVAADSISVDVSDFMTNGANNRLVTATGTDGMNAETNLTFDGSTLAVTGALTATTKSFVIDHPTKPGMMLRHGSLEGPEDGVYVRGRLNNENVIHLPDYWIGLVHADSITVNLTAIGAKQELWVKDITDNKVIIESDSEINCFFTVFATRKDVQPFEIEYEK